MLAPGALKLIAKDLQGLIQKPPEDIQVVNNDQDLTEIKAWIRGPGKNKKESSLRIRANSRSRNQFENGVHPLLILLLRALFLSAAFQTTHLMKTVTFKWSSCLAKDTPKHLPKVTSGKANDK